MQIEYEELTREVDNRIAAIDLNGKHIIRDCKAMLVFLKEKLTELKVFVQSEPFRNDTDEIDFFKQYKPKILGPLFYFHHILRIESQRPLDEKELDGYYENNKKNKDVFRSPCGVFPILPQRGNLYGQLLFPAWKARKRN